MQDTVENDNVILCKTSGVAQYARRERYSLSDHTPGALHLTFTVAIQDFHSTLLLDREEPRMN